MEALYNDYILLISKGKMLWESLYILKLGIYLFVIKFIVIKLFRLNFKKNVLNCLNVRWILSSLFRVFLQLFLSRSADNWLAVPLGLTLDAIYANSFNKVNNLLGKFQLFRTRSTMLGEPPSILNMKLFFLIFGHSSA